MSHNVSLKYYTNRTLLLILLVLFGFISSRALISIGTGLLALNLILSFKEHKWRFFNKENLGILIALLFFLVSALSIFFSPDYQIGLKQLYYRLPWLVIPLSIGAMTAPKTAFVHAILGFFVLIMTVSGMVVLINYLANYTYITAQIALAKNIPTPLNHIRYSLMVAFAGLVSIYFFVKNNTKLSPYDRIIFGLTSLFLFSLIHILSVRSGLLGCYLGLVYLIIYFAFHFKKWWLLPIFGILLIATPYIAYLSLPSLQNKVAYMRYDFEQIEKDNIGHNSDSRRWRSILMATELIKEQPILGSGLGQVENVSKKYYSEHNQNVEECNQKVPHNQFLYTTVEMGVVGLLALFILITLPFYYTGLIRKPLYTSLWIIVLASCLVENTFESQIGMSFYLLIGSLLLKQGKDE